MIESYWDLYVAYINKCVRDNWANDIDPGHYDMEWNHTLPQCLFGDWPIGQYLTLQQHAIASALQTLAFEKNCMCRWHKKDLPDPLVDLAWPYFKRKCADNGRKTVKVTSNHPNTIASRFETVKAMNEHPNTKDYVEKIRKRTLLTNISTGENFEFSSAREACRVLGLGQGKLCEVARGERKQHKGYTAVYL